MLHSNRRSTMVLAGLALMVCAGAPGVRAAEVPVIRRIESRIVGNEVRFVLWFSQASPSWASTLNQRDGWSLALLMAPGNGPPTQYQVDGTQLHGGSLPVYQFDHPDSLFKYLPADAATPETGRAPMTLEDEKVTIVVPVSALGNHGRGTRYDVQTYALVPEDEVIVRIDRASSHPGVLDDPPVAGLTLAGGHPNPVRRGPTRIDFTLPDARPARVALYDVTGRRVRLLVDDVLSPGPHSVTWDGRDESGRAVAPGMYVYRLKAGAAAALQRKLVVN